jgi:hypothetical protein
VLAESIGSTSGIWAPALRFHNGTFYLLTTMVHDKRADNDSSRWDNVSLAAKHATSYNDVFRLSSRQRICGMKASGPMLYILTLKDTTLAHIGMTKATHMLLAVMLGKWRESF